MKPISVSFRQLEYVISVADSGSTSSAARLLNVSQPSVSVAVAGLEEHLGQQLFQRISGHGLQLTPYGRQKLPELRRLLSQAEGTLARDTSNAQPYRLTLGVFSTLAPLYVPKLMRLFAETYPGSRVDLVEDDLQGLVLGLEAGRIDLALLYDVGLPSDITSVVLKDIRPYGLVAEDHRLADAGTVELRELLEDPLVLINLPHSRSFFLSLAQMEGIPVTIAAETGSIEMVRSMVANGFGVGLLATHIPYDQVYDGRRISRLELAGNVPPHRIVMARSSDLPISAASSAFLDLARVAVR